jgi:hypothetical protein
MQSMFSYTKAAMERAMKVQEVMLRAWARKITWWQAAEILGITDRHMRRIRERYEQFGYHGLFDRRRGKLSPKRVPVATVEKVLGLYREQYFDLNVRHFHEKLREHHQIDLSYTWVKSALQGAGLVARERSRGVHRKRRPRRPLPGMLLHIDGSRHQWFQDERWYDLIVILDDATSEIYHAQLTEEESKLTVMAGCRKWLLAWECFAPCRSAQSDANRPCPTPTRSADDSCLLATGARTLGAQLRHLARTLAVRLRGIRTLEAANRFLREHYIAEFNRHFQVPAAQPGNTFVRRSSSMVNRDNTVSVQNLRLQIEPVRWRATLAGCTGPQGLGHYSAQGEVLQEEKIAARGAVEKTQGGKVLKPTFPPCLEIPQTARVPTLPQPRLRLDINLNRHISLASKTGHFNLLSAQRSEARSEAMRGKRSSGRNNPGGSQIGGRTKDYVMLDDEFYLPWMRETKSRKNRSASTSTQTFVFGVTRSTPSITK